MNEPEAHINSYTAADIEKYHQGRLLPAERHAMEKAALDDPFLADALEGYEQAVAPAADMELLKERLSKRIDEKRRAVPVFSIGTWAKAAAVVLVIITGSWLIIHSFNKKETHTAMERPATPATEVADSAPPEVVPLMTQADSITETDRPTPPAVKRVVPGKSTDNAVSAEGRTEKPGQPAQTAPVVPVPEKPSVITMEEKKDVATDAARSYDFRLQKQQSFPVQNRKAEAGPFYRNRNVIVQNNGEANYKVQMNKSVGADDKNNDTIRNFNVVMKPDTNNALAEVIVLNKGKKVYAATRPEPIIDTLEPEPGWSKYDDYIAANIKTPEELQIKPQQGMVELSFDIDKNGDPVNVKVTKSLCDKCDEEAIRLLKEGPKWKKKKSKKGRIAIRF